MNWSCPLTKNNNNLNNNNNIKKKHQICSEYEEIFYANGVGFLK